MTGRKPKKSNDGLQRFEHGHSPEGEGALNAGNMQLLMRPDHTWLIILDKAALSLFAKLFTRILYPSRACSFTSTGLLRPMEVLSRTIICGMNLAA